MSVKIYRPARNAMQSGTASTRRWTMVFEETEPQFVEPLMGWTGSRETTRQIRLYFDTKEEAIAHAKRKGLAYSLESPHERRVRPKSYAANFAFHKTQYADPGQS